MVIAIDPGPTKSAVVGYASPAVVVYHYTFPNEQLREDLVRHAGLPYRDDTLVIEQIAAMGMAVGAEVFETCFESGRFAQAWGRPFERLKRVTVKAHICGSAKAKDANVRRALMDRFGGDASVKKGGALYKVKGDEWAALAAAVTWADLHGTQL